MARFISDQNKVVILHESGTYANATAVDVWPGQVTEHSIDDAENKIISRFLGTATRSLDSVELGPRDVTGTLSFHPQDMRLPFFIIGSVFSTSGTNSVHTATETNTDARQSGFTSGTLNPPFSFTIEDSKQAPGTGQNFVRTINGAVLNTVTVTASQSEKVSVETEYVGQTLTWTSGATTSVTEETNTPYLWSDTTLTMSGLSIDTAKEVSFTVNQNVEPPHYLDGTRDISVPFPQNREYTLSVTLDLDASDDKAKVLYDNLYKNNVQFNTTLDFNRDSSTGSQHATFTLSGCRIVSMENPSVNEGLTESSVEVTVETVNATSYDSTAGTSLYGPF